MSTEDDIGATVKIRSRWDDCDRYGHVNEIHGPDGGLVAANRARDAFLDLEDRIRPAPAHLLRDLLRGEPSA